MIAFAMAKTSYSGEMIRSTKKAILTIPGSTIAEAVADCGMSTGRNTDKVTEFEITMQSIQDSHIQIPRHSRVAIKCSLKEFLETGDHYLYICDVEQVYANEQEEALFAWNGYAQIHSLN